MRLTLSAILLGLGLLSLAGCASTKEKKAEEALIAACPAKHVEQVKTTRAFIESLTPGRTPAKALQSGPKPFREVALIRPHEPTLLVSFYKVGFAGCPWVESENPNVPVISETFKGGMVLGYGRETLKQLQDQGWLIAERQERWLGRDTYQTPPWPWQAWDYVYLPRK